MYTCVYFTLTLTTDLIMTKVRLTMRNIYRDPDWINDNICVNYSYTQIIINQHSHTNFSKSVSMWHYFANIEVSIDLKHNNQN